MTHTVGRSRRRPLALGIATLTTAALTLQSSAIAASPDDGPTAAQQQALDAGFQIAPKGAAAKVAARPNPYLANLPDLTKADYAGWRARLAQQADIRVSSADYRADRRAANRATPALAKPVVHDEQEPDGTSGSNDSAADAERIRVFGTGAGKRNVVRILGEKADLGTPTPDDLAPVAEDNGSIPLAGDTAIDGVAAVETTGVLGDGPHGSTGDGTNDFDFYEVEIDQGLVLRADTSGQTTDTVLALYDAAGTLVAADDDSGTGFASLLTYRADAAGTYYLMVGGYSSDGPLPADPFDSGSGAGGADEGPYDLLVSTEEHDSDYYAVRLKPGDVVGGVAEGSSDFLTVFRPDGVQMHGSGQDASSLYAPDSPLPGGGNAVLAYVAEEPGWYVLNVDGDVGDYSVQIEGYRPGAELDEPDTQTVFLDFEGGRVNTGIWGGPGVRTLSPFASFLGKWGIARARQKAMIKKVALAVEAHLEAEVADGGLNPDLQVDVVTSRSHPEVEGDENVSRVLVSGTIAESGIPTIGIAQFIDPGNYGHEDQSLVLLDVLSDPAGDDASLNTYIEPESDREAFVVQALSNVIAHEVGHTVGNYHTDNASDQVNLMDSGGANFDNLFGVGPDGVGGTADDLDVRFTEDVYSSAEGFTGIEDTQNVTAWAYPSL